ncbi:MAG: hypothetical protein N3E47_02935 [Candidatus Bathyarchaeota archaeon]|nr:hypothetical protein [Candidatus Bathyarchaeota archaeon]
MSCETYENKAAIIAKSLVRSRALKFGSFILKSGIISPYYIDLSWLLSSPEDFERVACVVAEEMRQIILERNINKLATIELKGALMLPHIACALNIPCIVIRKESKIYGLAGRIAGGEIEKGERFIFFDDVITDGRSKIEGIKPIEDMGGVVDTIVVVVDREQGGREYLERIGYRVKPITTISEIVSKLLEMNSIKRELAEEIMRYVREAKANSGAYS